MLMLSAAVNSSPVKFKTQLSKIVFLHVEKYDFHASLEYKQQTGKEILCYS